jgi:O-antigen/teichoic acid export membrane protein
MKGLIKLLKSQSFISLFGNGISALLGLLSFALLARFTNKQDLGIWIVFFTVYGIFDTLRTGMVLNAFIKNFTQSKNEEERNQVIGSSWHLSVLVNIIFVVFTAFCYLIFFIFNILPEYQFFFIWLILISIFSLPFNFAIWLLNAQLKILKMSYARILNQILFIILIVVFLEFIEAKKIVLILFAYTLAQLITSIFCIIKGWSGILFYFHKTKEGIKELFHFGKYSMGTLIGSNLLRSSDSFLIGKFLGTIAVATYNVPSKVVDVFDLVIRSFAITNMPVLSKIYSSGDLVLLKKEFERKTGFLFLLLLPASIISFVFAEQIIVILAGNQYKDAAYILKLFAIYTALTPIDKLSGVMLDIINKPNLNYLKVLLMLFVNVVGDVFCLYYYGTLESVAIVSIFTFATGVVYGMYLLNKHINVSFSNLFVLGYREFVFKFNDLTKNSL